jgi:predicted Zn-dependent protease with MMP-like domain
LGNLKVGVGTFERLVVQALDDLPEFFRARLENIEILSPVRLLLSSEYGTRKFWQ